MTSQTAEFKARSLYPQLEVVYDIEITFGTTVGGKEITRLKKVFADIQADAIRDMAPRLNEILAKRLDQEVNRDA